MPKKAMRISDAISSMHDDISAFDVLNIKISMIDPHGNKLVTHIYDAVSFQKILAFAAAKINGYSRKTKQEIDSKI